MKTKHLTPWQAGVSGNPNGRPKGSKNIRSVIKDMLDNPEIYELLPNKQFGDKGTPLAAIIATLMAKALDGDVRAADVLLKYVVPRDIPDEIEGGFFSQNTELVIRIVEPDGSLKDFRDPNSHWTNADPIPSETPKLVGHQFMPDMPAEEKVS